MVKKEADYINKFDQSRDIISQFLITTKEIRKDKNNKPYVEFTLQDNTGSIKARMFTNNCKKRYDNITINQVYNIVGKVRELLVGSKKYNILIDDIRDSKKYDMDDFIRTAHKLDQHIDYFFNIQKEIKNKDLINLLSSIFTDEALRERFINAPAAKIHHHNYKGGLIVHTNEVISICLNLCEIYEKLDKDLLLTAAILHDIGKIETYDMDENNLISINRKGKLLDHIYIGAKMIENRCEMLNVNEETKTKLVHMILSHHGQKELGWGSTVDPLIPEAVALHHADDISAKITKLMDN
jgi:3'-5' exoribonuclease